MRSATAHGELPIGIRWIIEGEEEMGSTNFAEIARQHASLLRADAAFWEGSPTDTGGRPEIAIGFKGVLAFRLDIETMDGDAHSGSAGVLPSAPWRLIDAINAIRNVDGQVMLPGFHDAVVPPSDGALAALDDFGDSLEVELRDAYGVDRFVDGLSGAEFRHRLAFEPSFNIAGISTGYRGSGMKTVTPSKASAWFDFRLVPDQRCADVLAALRARLHHAGFGDVEVTVLAEADPISTPIDHPLVRQVAAITEHVERRPAADQSDGAGLAALAHRPSRPRRSARAFRSRQPGLRRQSGRMRRTSTSGCRHRTHHPLHPRATRIAPRA